MARHGWLLVVVAGAVVWAGSLENPFQYDDIHSIVDNLHVRSLDLATVFADPASFSVDADKGMFRPLLVTTFALNHAVGGYDVTGYHVVNVTIHVANAVLVWWLCGLLGAGAGGRLAAGLLFVLHPVASEPVNYISSRSESLAALLYLFGLAWFVHVQQRPFVWRFGVWLAMAAGLLTKSTVFTLPAVLLGLDYLLLCRGDLGRLRRRLLTHHLPGWGVAAGYLAIVTANRWLTRSLEQDVRGPVDQLLTQAKALVYYAQLLVLPSNQSVDPQFFVAGAATVLSACAALAGSLLLATAWLYRARAQHALFLILWVALYMLPTTVVPLNVLVNERRAYVPLAVLCVAVGLLLVPALRRLPARAALGLLGALALASLSVQRTAVWADDLTLWTDAATKGPRMARSHLYLGNAHKDLALRETDVDRRQRYWLAAATSYERAFEEARDDDLALRALNNRGGVFFKLGEQAMDAGRLEEALAHYGRAEEIYRIAEARNPIYADALVNLGNSALIRARYTPGLSVADRRQRLEESIEFYERALAVRPNHSQAHSNMAVAYEDLGRFEEAEASYRHSLYLNGRDWLVMKNLANLLQRLAAVDAEQGRRQQAEQRLLEARRLIGQALRMNAAVPGGEQVRQVVEERLRALGGG